MDSGRQNLLEDTLIELGYSSKLNKIVEFLKQENKLDLEWCEYTSHVEYELEQVYGEGIYNGELFKKVRLFRVYEIYPHEILAKDHPACFIGKRCELNGASVYYRNSKGEDTVLTPTASLKLINHSPDGFEWGYAGSGPSQLSLAILLKACGKEMAMNYYDIFKWDVITQLPRDKYPFWTLTVADVKSWVRETHDEHKHLFREYQ